MCHFSGYASFLKTRMDQNSEIINKTKQQYLEIYEFYGK
jgi:hypothetical protein